MQLGGGGKGKENDRAATISKYIKSVQVEVITKRISFDLHALT
jgi:hypothetical protein